MAPPVAEGTWLRPCLSPPRGISLGAQHEHLGAGEGNSNVDHHSGGDRSPRRERLFKRRAPV